jgi:hypothetical protein
VRSESANTVVPLNVEATVELRYVILIVLFMGFFLALEKLPQLFLIELKKCYLFLLFWNNLLFYFFS